MVNFPHVLWILLCLIFQSSRSHYPFFIMALLCRFFFFFFQNAVERSRIWWWVCFVFVVLKGTCTTKRYLVIPLINSQRQGCANKFSNTMKKVKWRRRLLTHVTVNELRLNSCNVGFYTYLNRKQHCFLAEKDPQAPLNKTSKYFYC